MKKYKNNNNNNNNKFGFPGDQTGRALVCFYFVSFCLINRYKNKCGGDLSSTTNHTLEISPTRCTTPGKSIMRKDKTKGFRMN
jgi:hypothetical protein